VKLDLITLQSHISHVLKPLDVACFKLFKTTFKNIRICEPYLTKEKVVGMKIRAMGFFSTKKNIEFTQHM
jgi:hypothetical protein